jgi:uncharacterized protein
MFFLKRKLREFYRVFICLQGDPRKIAMGMAIGVFIGVTPTIPFHTVLAIGFIFLFRQNLPAALLGNWITNPITIPFFYFSEYEIGKYVLGWGSSEIILHTLNVHELLKLGWEIFVPLQLGGLILAPFFAVPAYFITHRTILAIRRRGTNADSERSAEKI